MLDAKTKTPRNRKLEACEEDFALMGGGTAFGCPSRSQPLVTNMPGPVVLPVHRRRSGRRDPPVGAPPRRQRHRARGAQLLRIRRRRPDGVPGHRRRSMGGGRRVSRRHRRDGRSGRTALTQAKPRGRPRDPANSGFGVRVSRGGRPASRDASHGRGWCGVVGASVAVGRASRTACWAGMRRDDDGPAGARRHPRRGGVGALLSRS